MTNQPPLLPDQLIAGDTTRAAYRERLRQALRDPAFRATEGFPLGDDEAILALSDPPYYTACPNPFLQEIIQCWQAERDDLRYRLYLPDDSDGNGNEVTGLPQSAIRNPQPYHREPFAADVSEGKNDPIYNAHSYHTKVPHKAIMRYILHYTDPGDVVFDGFCGTGMTGVAAQLCADRKAVQELGYLVDEEGVIYDVSKPISRLGARKTVLVDLSPAATFIAYNYNTPVNVAAFEREAQRILREVEDECGWMYETWHPHCNHLQRVKGRVNYTIWSDVFVCPACGAAIIFWEAAVDKEAGEVRDSFPCPYCGAMQSKRSMERACEIVYDRALNRTIRRAKQIPVLINYSVGKNRYDKTPDAEDMALGRRIEESDVPDWLSTYALPDGYNTRQPMESHGITHVHHFYTRRSLLVLAAFCHRITEKANTGARNALMWTLTAVTEGSSKLNRERVSGLPSKLAGTLYVASTIREINAISFLYRKAARLAKSRNDEESIDGLFDVITATQSSTRLTCVADASVDYIFVDPPFGGNLMYSELNLLWEAWLRVFTNNKPEAIINEVQRKSLAEYQQLMEQCFHDFHRVLKPGRWMTVEFHNSQNRIWNAIQEAILRAGFMIADVRTLDKQQGTFKQVTTTAAVKQDLVISAYKPNDGLEARFKLEAGTPQGAWDFTRQHLARLPVVVTKDGAIEVVAERQHYLLFDRMVAFHIQRGATVPLSAAEFYAGLKQRFVERDSMFFLPDQVPEYDRARLQASRIEQLSLFVSDEKSTIQWLRQQLAPSIGGQPQTYQGLQPQFLCQFHPATHEAMPELLAILEQNFLQDEAGRWYVPDPSRASDLEKLRQKTLLREFAQYMAGRGRLRQFRTEAVRAGFADAWHRRDFTTIVQVAQRLPETVLQEDPELLMYYDNATLRVK